MILVGGGSVNFHGYHRHSAAVDFWIDISDENLDRLRFVLNDMGYLFEEYPTEVKSGLQNISVKISPVIDIELVSRFNPGKTFDEAYAESVVTTLRDNPSVIYRVLKYADLINSKIKSGRPKDLLDIQELNRLRNIHDESE